jgi:prevent-host-death family protein
MSSPAFDITTPLSDLVETTLKAGPQVVTRNGVETAVLVSIEEWKRLKARGAPSLKEILLDPNGPHDIPLPAERPVLILRPFSFDNEAERL